MDETLMDLRSFLQLHDLQRMMFIKINGKIFFSFETNLLGSLEKRKMNV